MNRDYRYYVVLAAILYIVGGLALALNTLITIGALRASGVPELVAILIAVLFSSTAVAIGVFLTSPSEWTTTWDQFTLVAAGAANSKSKSQRQAAKLVLALMILLLVAYLLGIYAADTISTWDQLTRDTEPGFYHVVSTLGLIVGPECSFVLAYAQWQQSKLHRLTQVQRSSVTDPEITYLSEARIAQIKSAREAAKATSGQYQHPGNNSGY